MAGTSAGAITGVLATRFQINGLLAGILVMTALYSINLHVMGKSNLPLMKQQTVVTMARNLSHEEFQMECGSMGSARPGYLCDGADGGHTSG